MKMIIEQMPLQSIAFIRNVGPYGEDNYKTMEKIKKFAKENNLFNDDTIILGIARDNPKLTKLENCRYDACIVAAQDFNKSDIQKGILSGGKYAVFTIEHTKEAVQRAWNEMFPYVISKGYKMDLSREIIERYAVKMVKNNKCEICIPVV